MWVSLVSKTLDESEAVKQAETAMAHEPPKPGPAEQASAAQPEPPKPEAAEHASAAQPEPPKPEAAQQASAAQPEPPKPDAAEQASAAQPEPPKPEAAEQASAAQPEPPKPEAAQAPKPEAAEQASAAPDAAEGKEALLSEQPPAEKGGIAQPEPAAAPPVAGLPALAPVRIVLNVARDDVRHHRRAADIRQALAAAGLEVADHVPVDPRRPGLSIGYYFQSDRNAAAEVSHVLQPLLGAVDPAPIRKRGNIPEPGTIEVAIP
jgi:nicotinate-nucleotide--dimethylbenzimidazole phosphoribosyltransferase